MNNKIYDHLLCPVCKGKKVILNEATQKMELCPKCSMKNEEVTKIPKRILHD
jgi:rubredoxin